MVKIKVVWSSAIDVEACFILKTVGVVTIDELVSIIVDAVVAYLGKLWKGRTVHQLIQRAVVATLAVGIIAVDELIAVVVDTVVTDGFHFKGFGIERHGHRFTVAEAFVIIAVDERIAVVVATVEAVALERYGIGRDGADRLVETVLIRAVDVSVVVIVKGVATILEGDAVNPYDFGYTLRCSRAVGVFAIDEAVVVIIEVVVADLVDLGWVGPIWSMHRPATDDETHRRWDGDRNDHAPQQRGSRMSPGVEVASEISKILNDILS